MSRVISSTRVDAGPADTNVAIQTKMCVSLG